ncbi:hypothetical protein SAMN05519104_4326 [Rhizobiales bacterium GAS188]|nr:hypothetical protein SAMN05519104_4326 [Rhizobiales bacterium GAS188]
MARIEIPFEQKRFASVQLCSAVFDVSVTSLYQGIDRGDYESVTDGRRRLIVVPSILAYYAKKSRAYKPGRGPKERLRPLPQRAGQPARRVTS